MFSLSNPFIIPPLKLGYSDGKGGITAAHHRFYLPRSRHVGAVALEPLYLDASLREIPTQIGLDDDDKIPGLTALIEAMHGEGAQVIAHLNHPGRMANPKIPGNVHLSSTDRACENGGAVPRRMTEEDMDAAVALFVEGARRAKRAGFDIIELQLGHGYLLAQFLSPAVNDRDDAWGGSFENRARFPLRVVEAVKGAVDLPVIVRLSGDEMIDGGIKMDETIALGRLLAERGVDALHISAGTVCSTPPWFFQHMFVPKGKTWEMAGKVREAIDLPVIAVGRVETAEDVERLREEFHVDYIAVGRAMVADPDFTGKVLGEVDGAIRPCLACSDGCLGGVRSGKGLRCVVNPRVGYDDPEPSAPSKVKKVAIVGGGLAGMEVALTLRGRGHEVTLYEKERLGGQFNLAWLAPGKQSLRGILDYYEEELSRSGVKVLREEADAKGLESGGFDEVVVATGAVPAVPPIEGLRTFYWTEFLEDEHLPREEKVLVIGGGLIGIEIASKLVSQDNEVVIVEMLEEVARGMEAIEKAMTLKKLAAKGTVIHTRYRVSRVDGGRIELDGSPPLVIEDVDRIVVATGMRSRDELSSQLSSKLPVHVIGDAKQVGKAQDAIRDGYLTGRSL